MKTLVFYILTICCISVYSQVEVTQKQTSANAFTLDEFWNVSLRNFGGSAFRVIMEAELLDQEQNSVLKAKTYELNLPPGTHQFIENSLQTAKVEYPSGSSEVPQGTYMLCISVKNVINEQQLGQTCRPYVVTNSGQFNSDYKDKSDKLIHFSGTTQLTGRLSNQQGLFQEIPPSYLRWQFSPTLTVKEIPLTARVYYSTEQNKFRYDLNTINFGLNPQQLKQNLYQKAAEKLQYEERMKKMGKPFDKDFLNKLEAIRSKDFDAFSFALKELEGSKALDKWRNMKDSLVQLDRIEEVLNHPVLKSTEKDWKKMAKEYGLSKADDLKVIQDSVCQKNQTECARIKKLYHKVKEIERLKERKEELEKLKEKVNSIEKKLPKGILDGGKDYEALIRNPETIKELGFLTKAQKVLGSFHKLGFGVTFPHYSNLTLDGISVKGADIAVTPEKFYTAFTVGKIGRTAFVNDSLDNEPAGKIFAGKVGWGTPEDNHVHLTVLHANRPEDSVINQSIWYSPLPQSNTLLGLSGRWKLLGDKMMIEGQWAGSTWERRISGDIWQDTLDQEIRRSDQAWEVRAQGQLFDGKTLLVGSYGHIGPDYFSLGAPLLITNREKYDIQVNQSLRNGKINLTGYWRKDENQFLPYQDKPNRTQITSSGLRVDIREKNLPYVQLDFSPYYQQNNLTDSLEINNRLSVLTANVGHNYQIGSAQLSSSLIFSQQINRSQDDAADFSANLFTLNQTITFSIPISIFATGTYFHSGYSQDFDETWSWNISGNATLFKKWNLAFGFTKVDEKGDLGLQKKGLFINNTINITKQIIADFRLEKNNYNNHPLYPTDFNEFIAGGSIIYRW